MCIGSSNNSGYEAGYVLWGCLLHQVAFLHKSVQQASSCFLLRCTMQHCLHIQPTSAMVGSAVFLAPMACADIGIVMASSPLHLCCITTGCHTLLCAATQVQELQQRRHYWV
jgi:hypothetical protein